MKKFRFVKNIFLFALILFVFSFYLSNSRAEYDFTKLKTYSLLLENDVRQKRPFIAYYKNKEQEVYYIAAIHSTDAKSATFKLIQEIIETVKPDLLILEGIKTSDGLSPANIIDYVNKNCTTSQELKCGEPLFAISLASSKNIPFRGIEPDDKKIFAALESQGYEKNDIFGFYFTRQIPQYFSEKQVTDVRELPQKFDELMKVTGVQGINLTYAAYQNWLNQKMGRVVNLSELNDTQLSAPLPNGTLLQQISSKINPIRDQHMLKVILDSASSYKKILVILGASHYVTQKDVLIQYLGEPTYMPN